MHTSHGTRPFHPTGMLSGERNRTRTNLDPNPGASLKLNTKAPHSVRDHLKALQQYSASMSSLTDKQGVSTNKSHPPLSLLSSGNLCPSQKPHNAPWTWQHWSYLTASIDRAMYRVVCRDFGGKQLNIVLPNTILQLSLPTQPHLIQTNPTLTLTLSLPHSSGQQWVNQPQKSGGCLLATTLPSIRRSSYVSREQHPSGGSEGLRSVDSWLDYCRDYPSQSFINNIV